VSSTAVAQAAAQLRDLLSEGVEPEQAQWAETGYAEWILPRWIDVDLPSPHDLQRWRTECVEGLRADLASLPADQRWPRIVENIYRARLQPLSEEAFDLALRSNDPQGRDEGLRERAAVVAKSIHDVDRELTWLDPGARRRLAAELGNAALDCAWAIEGGTAMSPRLGATLATDRAGSTR
jgi:hypothetical protein